MAKIDELRDAAYHETLAILKETKRAVIIRPTGFGKTGILTRLIKDYQHVLYLYPTEIIRDAVLLFWYKSADKIPADRNIPNVTFMTYMALANLAHDNAKRVETMRCLSHTDLIICDECHRIGAEGTSNGLDYLLSSLPDVHMVGATATPERMDTVDELARYFEIPGKKCQISEYNLHDAFKDGILKRPYYYYFNYLNADKDIKNLTTEARKEIALVDDADERLKLAKHLKASLVQISQLERMPHVIKEVCHKYAADENYMRFIAFFSSFNEVDTNGEKVQAWFREAYPDYNIRILRVTSETDETRENAKAIKNMKPADKTIDLILSCNMMNMGYHVDSLTGIIMYRGTQSGIVYTQQLGRVLSSGTDHAGICFDVVDNLHTESMYSLLGHPSGNLVWRRERQKTLIRKKALHDAASAVRGGETDPETLLTAYPDLTNTEIEDIIANPDAEAYTWSDGDERELASISRTIKAGPRAHAVRNTLQPEDLVAVAKESTYRDLILKTVAEAKSMRCRQAWARWLEEGGKATDPDGRPLSRKEVLAQLPPDQIPLPPFCESKHVSVDAVLDEMGVKNN